MLPTFVIGLREGLEAALIVGIIAAFLRTQGRGDLLRWVFVGVGTAIALCVGVGVALDILSRDLPQRQQEGLETVVGALAIAMVTYMVVWMRRHSRELKGSLEGAAASALNTGTERAARALVLMAFLAVLREGFETVVFLLAAFNETGSGASPVAGAIIGIAVAVVLGWGIYRGGVSLNLSKFFRITGLVLVLVAAGLVMNAFHTAHEAGWLNVGQGSTFDMSWLVRTGTVRASLLTGILGLQPRPVVIELAGWLVYLIPIATYVAWPQGKRISPQRFATAATAMSLLAAVTAAVLVIASPAKPVIHPRPVGLTPAGTSVIDGLQVERYVRTATADFPAGLATREGLAAQLSDDAVARLNGGRLPLGVAAGSAKIAVTYAEVSTDTVDVARETNRLISRSSSIRVMATAHSAVGSIPLSRPVRSSARLVPSAVLAAAVAAARHDSAMLDRRDDLRDIAGWLAGLAAVLLVAAGGALAAGRRRSTRPPTPSLDGTTAPLIERQVSLT